MIARSHMVKASMVLSELEKSKVVDERRCRFACGTVITGMTLWIPLLVVFYLFFTPVSIWYSTTHVYDLTHYLEVSFESSLTPTIVDRQGWYNWHQINLLGMYNNSINSIQESGLVAPYGLVDTSEQGGSSGSGDQLNVTYLLNENVILGPLSIVGIRAIPTPCAYPGSASTTTTTTTTTAASFDLSGLTCYAPFDTSTMEWTDSITTSSNTDSSSTFSTTHPVLLDANGGGHLLPVNQGGSVGMQDSYDVLEELKKNNFLDDSTRLVVTSINAYNPHLQLFTTVLVRSEFITTGAVEVSVRVESAHLHPTFPTFPPSILFEVFLSLGGISFMAYRIIVERRNRRWSSFQTTWEWAQWSIEIFFYNGVFLIILALVPYSMSLRWQIESLHLLVSFLNFSRLLSASLGFSRLLSLSLSLNQ